MPPLELRHIRAAELHGDTAQSAGMTRTEAVSGRTVGAMGLWMGRTVVAPGATSAAHHHGESETAIYVVSGTPVFSFRRDGRIVEVATAPGDYVFVPPHLPHIESNPGDEPAVVVIARTTQEAIAVDLDGL
jgi:uncharacterized RmlC-like cupin family protein